MAAKKTTLSNSLLDLVLRNQSYSAPAAVYAALFTVAPTASAGGTEVTGGAYARQAITFAAASAGSVSNSAAITFPVATASWGTVVAVGICDAASAGNQLYYGTLGTSKAIDTGDQASFAISALTVSET